MKKLFIFTFSSLLFTSCVYDPPLPEVRIINSSDAKIKVIIKFNKDFLTGRTNAYTRASDYDQYTGDYSPDCVQLVHFDTVKFVGTYTLQQGCFINLDMAGFDPPNVKVEYDTVTIISKDGIVKFSGEPKDLQLFQKRKWDQYELEIE